MRKVIYAFLFLGFLHVAYGIFVSQWTLEAFAPETPSRATEQKLFYDYAGVIDVHTKKSTGSGDISTITQAATADHLDFLVLNDLNDFKPDLSLNRYFDRVLVFVGGAYNYLDALLLNFDEKTIDHLQGPGRSQTAFADLLSTADRNRSAGLLILSRPYNSGYHWDGDFPPGLDGIEVYNLKSLWQEHWLRSKGAFFWSLAIYPYNSTLAYLRLFIRSSADQEITLWDRLNSKQPTLGFAGTDADAKIRLWGHHYWAVPSYETLFSIVKNHVLIRSELTGQAAADRQKISEALRHGQFYFSLDILANPRGFTAYGLEKNKVIPLGSEAKISPGLVYVVNLPDEPLVPFQTILYKDGQQFATSTDVHARIPIQSPGVYRALVRLRVSLPWPDGAKWIDWILTNPMYIRGR